MTFDEVVPDAKHNWINLTSNDFESLIPLARKGTKAGEKAGKERAIFELYSLGASTNRDEWVTAFSSTQLQARMKFFVGHYEQRIGSGDVDQIIKWSETLLRRCRARLFEPFDQARLSKTLYRPFVSMDYYKSEVYIDRPGQSAALFPVGDTNRAICFMAGDRQPFSVISTGMLPNLNMFSADAIQYVAVDRFDGAGNRIDNITDPALRKFSEFYKLETGTGKSARKINKEAIFHYCYAVLHDPVYREKYAQNLKREFPRIPYYPNFWQWAEWGRALMDLHIGYEAVEPAALARTDVPDEKARAAGQAPKAMLKADKDVGCIQLDSETTLAGIPPEAWDYKLGNRAALEWILNQYKEKKPKDPTIREKFDTYRFADHKETVVDLLMRVTTVSVRTVEITRQMQATTR